jgi:magnesium chelatase family protein
MNRLSGPLLDRIDIHVEVPALSYDEIAGGETSGPTSAEVRGEVQAARTIQRERYQGRFECNAYIDSRTTRTHCVMVPGAEALLKNAIDSLGFSARAYDKLLRIARTLADLERAELIGEVHIAEAIQYRSLDRDLF